MSATDGAPSGGARRGSGGAFLVAAAAALWGTDALFRRPLALDLPSGTVVLGEHLVLVAVLLPLLPGAWRALARLDARGRLAVLVVGAGASATATALFTAAFTYGDPTTPLLLQKLQPVVAVLGARVVLGERLHARYWGFFAAALAGAWLISFPDPLRVTVSALTPALLAVGAATLWALGTVLGRYLSATVAFQHLTTLRFAVGLPAAALVVALQGEPVDGLLDGSNALAVVLLALVPGLVALLLYYRGLRETPASVATLAELAFPLSAIVLNAIAFDTTPTAGQWVGIAVLAGTVVVLGRESDRRRAGVEAPPVEVAPAATAGR